jgi:hypothetical protein
MSVTRQQNFLGQQRIDVPALRSLESSIANDFDVLAGRAMAGRAPLIISGLKMITTGAVSADQLQLHVADSVVVHFNASESGSIFNIAPDRAVERLNSTNARMFGSFAPSATNYVGIDFLRVEDEDTADLTMFLDATQEQEIPRTVPLARIIDYKIVVSTRDFAAMPGVCPIAKVVTNASNEIVSVADARNLFFRLGSGGASPDSQFAFPWPGGRKEITSVGDVFTGGDKAITSQKGWMDAVMTRIWEVAGGEYWYSPTSERNIRFLHTGSPFVSTGEYFEWDGTHVHFKGLRVAFDNSTANYNQIADQTTNLAGLTDLLDGECLYVDLDRTNVRSGGTSLVAQKAPLTTLGAGTPPGSRLVFAWRFGTQVFTRDQGYAINSSFKIATIAANGTVRLSASAQPTPSEPVVATVQGAAYYQAFCGGITRGYTGVTPIDFIGGSGDLVIGGGDKDQNILLACIRTQDGVDVTGRQVYLSGGKAALTVTNDPSVLAPKNRILALRSYNSGASLYQDAMVVEANGAVGFRNAVGTVAAPDITSASPIRTKMYFTTNGMDSPDTRDQLVIMGWDGDTAIIWESNPY